MDDYIRLAHGDGGQLMQELLDQLILPTFSNPLLASRDDGALLPAQNGQWAFTTDSYVITPWEFPGGNIGSLAVAGTINDLAVMGARPQYLSCALIIEAGTPTARLRHILQSMRQVADSCGVTVVTGDTKVIESKGTEEVYVNTAGLGLIPEGVHLSLDHVRPGDAIVVNGTLGDHAVATVSRRPEFSFQSGVVSDCAPLYELIQLALDTTPGIRFMRDVTRGGLVTVLNEMATTRSWGIEISQSRVPVHPEVRAIAAMLGLDPLYLANEGKVVFAVDAGAAESLVRALRSHQYGRNATVVGHAVEGAPGRVYLRTELGTTRLLDVMSAEQLPRIC